MEGDVGALRKREEVWAAPGVRSTCRNDWVDKGANKYRGRKEWMMKEEKIGGGDESDSGEVRIGEEDARRVCCVLSWD